MEGNHHMKTTKTIFAAATMAVALGGFAAGGFAADTVPASVTAAVGHYARPPADQTRDAARNPAQVLALAGIKSGMVVADFLPEDGYYTRILSKLVGPKGHVYGYVPIPGFPGVRQTLEKDGKPVPIDPILAIENQHSEYPNVTAVWEQVYYNGGSFGLPAQVDAVVAGNGNYHNLKTMGYAVPATTGPNNAPGKPLDLVGMNKAIFRAMKPGGVYIIVDNASEADGIKADLTAAGFTLDGSSDAVAGQAVLKFKKPANASAENKRPKDNNWGMKNFFGNTRHSGVNNQVQRWVMYHPDGTFQEFGNTGTRVQQGTFWWDADGNNCMIKEYPDIERGSVICHDYADAINPVVDKVIGEGNAAWKVEPGYHYPAPPAPSAAP